MSRLFNISLLFILFLCPGGIVNAELIRNGELNLKNWDKKDIIELKGSWGFIPGRLVDPYGIPDNGNEPVYYVDVPGFWNDYNLDGVKMAGYGYATYFLKLNLPPGLSEDLAFDIPVFNDAYVFYINGKKYAQNGEVSMDAGSEIPEFNPMTVSCNEKAEELVLVFHVSNFNQTRGGFRNSVKMGMHSILDRYVFKIHFMIILGMGLFITSFIFFLLFFLFYRKNLSALFFSLGILGLVIKLLTTDSYPILLFFDIPWIWLVRFEYTGTYLSFIFATWYFQVLFRLPWLKKLTMLNSVIMGLIIIHIYLLKPGIFGYSMYYFKPVVLLFFVIYTGISLYYSIKRQGHDIYYLSGLLILLATLINGILMIHSKSTIISVYMVHLGVLLFVLLNSILIISSWAQNYRENLKLNREIEYLNMNLERKVKERVREIESSKIEIAEKGYEIETSKSEINFLSEYCDRFQDAITNGLKNPVNSIYHVADSLCQSLRDEEFTDSLDSIRDLSVSAVHILDNLIYLGRIRKDQVECEPQVISVQNLLNELKIYYQQNLKYKMQRIDILMKDEALVFCDPVHLKIVLKNIISNAIKYSEKEGKIIVTSAKPPDSEFNVILLEDNGIGITDDILKKLESKDISVEINPAKGTLNESGAGIGLKVCRELLRINRGKMRIDSQEGKGTRIMVFLPFI